MESFVPSNSKFEMMSWLGKHKNCGSPVAIGDFLNTVHLPKYAENASILIPTKRKARRNLLYRKVPVQIPQPAMDFWHHTGTMQMQAIGANVPGSLLPKATGNKACIHLPLLNFGSSLRAKERGSSGSSWLFVGITVSIQNCFLPRAPGFRSHPEATGTREFAVLAAQDSSIGVCLTLTEEQRSYWVHPLFRLTDWSRKHRKRKWIQLPVTLPLGPNTFLESHSNIRFTWEVTLWYAHG